MHRSNRSFKHPLGQPPRAFEVLKFLWSNFPPPGQDCRSNATLFMVDLWSNAPTPGTEIEKMHLFLVSLYFTKSNCHAMIHCIILLRPALITLNASPRSLGDLGSEAGLACGDGGLVGYQAALNMTNNRIVAEEDSNSVTVSCFYHNNCFRYCTS